jgi:hypothetical protein
LIPILQFVHTQVYKYCFGRAADGLERSVEGEDECELFWKLRCPWPSFADSTDMITMNQPPLTQHISIPKDMSQLSCEAFTAGIVEGVLDGLDVVSLGSCVCQRASSETCWPARPSSFPNPSLNHSRLQPARVTAHTVSTDQYPQRTVILVKLDPRVMEREATLGK